MRKKKLCSQFGRKLQDCKGSFNNDKYLDPSLIQWASSEYNQLGESKVTMDHMKDVIETIKPNDALKIGQFGMFFMTADERLYDRMCEPWQKKGKSKSDETPMSKLIFAKEQADLVRDQVIAHVPAECWQTTQHLSHKA